MPEFLGSDYLISNSSGLALYAGIEDLPIVDAHNHADVAEIAHNKHFTDIWQVEGATDHYFWEMLRKRGVAESLITGDAANREKWRAAASVWDDLAGNPTYEWVYLDLKRLLGIESAINAANADAIYDAAQAVFLRDDMRPQGLLKHMNVEVMCSTDDPIDSLEHHQALANSAIPGMVRPTFRPDRAMNVFKPDWRDYMVQLETRVNGSFSSIHDAVDALRICHDYFAENHCVASDHGLEVPYGYSINAADADSAFCKAWSGDTLSKKEEIAYMSYVLQEVAALDSDKGWVFQMHIGAVRDVRDHLAQTIGPDTGGDISNHSIDIVGPVRDLLNRFDNRLKVVLYCLDPSHQPTMATLSRAFGADVNLGSGWWFNDTPYGMRQQLEYVAGVDLLMNHIGMVSDSRKIASYASRHEMFRRILCDVLGTMVERGRVPMNAAERLAEHVAYHNQKAVFGL